MIDWVQICLPAKPDVGAMALWLCLLVIGLVCLIACLDVGEGRRGEGRGGEGRGGKLLYENLFSSCSFLLGDRIPPPRLSLSSSLSRRPLSFTVLYRTVRWRASPSQDEGSSGLAKQQVDAADTDRPLVGHGIHGQGHGEGVVHHALVARRREQRAGLRHLDEGDTDAARILHGSRRAAARSRRRC